jgi:hypothetical protein
VSRRTSFSVSLSQATRRLVAAVAAACLLTAPAVEAQQRTKVKPGINMFSPQQDVEIGRGVSADAEKKLPMLRDARVDRYVDALGKKLAAKAPGEKFPYQFKVVNDTAINAFALPGGFCYVNRGLIEAAENEAQLAGVIGHEIGHAALRHGTNQATKASLWQLGLGVGGSLAGGSMAGQVAQLGAGFFANSVLLKYSRDAESQADLVGTHLLYDAGYDPRAMADFFKKLSEEKGSRPPEFFSSHPNPENRYGKVTKEINKMGGVPARARADSAEFQEIKRYVKSLPKPKPGSKAASGGASGPPPSPSKKYVAFENPHLRLQYPDNWEVRSSGSAAILFPEGGATSDSQGRVSVAYGVMMNLYKPKNTTTLEGAHAELLAELRRANPAARQRGRDSQVKVDGERGVSSLLTNDSPVGGKELNWVVSVLRSDGLMYFVFTAPEKDFEAYDPAFQNIADSIRFVRR